MRPGQTLLLLLIVFSLSSCTKENKTSSCNLNTPTTREITNKRAVVKLTATNESVYLIEEGTIDSRLIPCNFPMEYYEHDLQVTISGEVKDMHQAGSGPCCAENFVIKRISR